MDRIERTERKFKELFGVRPTQDEGTDAEFMRILQRFIFGEVSYAGSLDNRMRELITVTVLTAEQTLPQLKAHVGACLNIGVDPVAIRETIYQCAPFIGFPRTLNAIEVINQVFREQGVALPLAAQGTTTERNRREKGVAIQKPLYGDALFRNGLQKRAFLCEADFG